MRKLPDLSYHDVRFQYVLEDLHGIQMKTFRHSKNVLESAGDTYSASLEINVESNKATGNYSCRSTQHKELAKNVFIYWEGNSPPYLVLAGKVLEIDVKPGSTSLQIPCYISNPTASVNLFKEIGGEFKGIQSNVKFDPKTGFELNFHNISDVIGRYRCVSGDDDEDEMDVMEAVIKLDAKGICKGSECFNHQVSPGTSFYYDKNTEELVCCGKGGSTKQTKLHTIFCWNPSVCRMYEPAMYLISGNNGKRSSNGSCVAEKLYPRDFGLVRCKGDGIDVFSYVYTEFWTVEQENLKAVFNWRELSPQNMVHLMIHATVPHFDNQLVTITCQTLHSYFSDGIKWGIKWANGSLTHFDSILTTDTNPDLHGIRSTYLRLSSSMMEIHCYAPVWNSTSWVDKSLKVDVKPSKSPTILGELVEELTFSLNDTEKMLECVSSGEPPANIKWMRNEQAVPRSMVIWNANGTSVLLFKTVTHQTHAVYSCIAMNVVGQARKTFRIFVEDSSNSSWSIAFAVVVPLFAIIVVGVFLYLMWRMKVQKKVVDHLTRVVFRDTNNT
ncbi:Tyrosine-protein kinase-like otk [Orchesella cincta]|uniref:Tyrosine-protein kinase-like otk n=1 Tax=Orchesella cincta TaxID=48709 RepID=A0A1D2NFB9_ORCCI|nr:Tyrosine-protein kinase-like otk [Orchesella cincta]